MARLTDGKVLVTGADGFIGSHLVEALVRAGRDVRALVLYNSLGSWGWLDRIAEDVAGQFEVVAGDVRDGAGLRVAMRGCDVVMHLAALIAIPYSYRSPQSYVETNVGGTLNVVQAARDLGVSRVIQTSTSEVYGTARTVPIGEDHPLQAQSPYAASKIGADQIALSFYRSFGTPVTVLRPFNTYGPRQSARAVIPTIITQVASGRQRIRLGAVHPTRDFMFVEDTVTAFVAAATSEAALGRTLNVGTGFEISVGAVARLIAEIMGREIDTECDAQRLRPAASEVDRLCADATKAAELIGWRPAYCGIDGLRRGLERTCAWFSEPSNLRLHNGDRYVL